MKLANHMLPVQWRWFCARLGHAEHLGSMGVTRSRCEMEMVTRLGDKILSSPSPIYTLDS